MFNRFNPSDYLKQIKLFLPFAALMLLLGCATVELPEVDAELNAVALVTPAAPAVPTQTVAAIIAAVEESEIEVAPESAKESEVDAYPEPVVEAVDDAYPVVESEAVAEVVQEVVQEETGQTAQIVTDLNPAAVVPAAEQSSSGSLELEWADLIPADFTPDSIYARYKEELAKYEPSDPESLEIQTKMQEELNNAPTNEELNGKMVRVPGFITPLDYTDDKVTEFLLVPYFGACIHVPAPPVNQTVFVTTNSGDGIKLEDTFAPIWVVGVMQTESTSTELATAGYTITDATIELYSDQQ